MYKDTFKIYGLFRSRFKIEFKQKIELLISDRRSNVFNYVHYHHLLNFKWS